MENFFVAANAVIPFLCYLSFGYLVVQKQVVSEEFMQKLNQMVFRLFFPCMTFYNIYKADHSEVPSVKLLVFLAAGILLTEAVLLLTVPRLVGENRRRGVIIQAIYRSNFILFGMPLTVSVFGDWASSAAAMVITEVTTIFNITSVMILELFHGEGKTSPAVLIKGLIKNPLLQGAVVGLIFFFFHLRLPECIVEPIAAFSSMTSPLALFILGGTIHFDAVGGNLKYLVPSLAVKLVLLPAVMIGAAWIAGLRGLELFFMITIFATPVATASYPMAQNMGGDGELAGQFVVISTVVSVLTLFFWIYFMKNTGLI